MNLNNYLPLTETTFYIMLSLAEPGHGYVIMQRVEELSAGNVRIAAGTMYGAIENLTKQKLIESVPTEDKRRKVYQLSDKGRSVLKLEVERLNHLVKVAQETKF